MAKKSKAELAEIWAKKNEICGDNPWFDKDRRYYNLRVEQILSMAKFIEKQRVVTKQS
jgi:hypothetical protein